MLGPHHKQNLVAHTTTNRPLTEFQALLTIFVEANLPVWTL